MSARRPGPIGFAAINVKQICPGVRVRMSFVVPEIIPDAEKTALGLLTKLVGGAP